MSNCILIKLASMQSLERVGIYNRGEGKKDCEEPERIYLKAED